MGKYHDRMAEDLKLRAYASSTCDNYLGCMRNFVAHYMRPPTELGEQEIRKYLLHLSEERKLGPSSLKTNVAAIKFFYNNSLGKPERVVKIPYPRVPKPLPDILSGTEVEELLMAVKSIKHRAVLMTAYGAGLRVNEACSLKTSDIDSTREVIHVRDGKRGRDRYVMLSQRLLEVLREYWRQTRPPKPWLFPGKDPKRPISDTSVREALKKAATAVGIRKRVTPHTLRHAFATHLLETNTDIRTIQVLLGHGSIRTTTRYAQVSTKHVARTKSPLDLIGTSEGSVLR